MLFLMQKAEADQAKASSYYFLIANGSYNMTEYGNSRMLAENNIMSILGSYNEEWIWKRNGAGGYYDCSKAEAYYMKAKLASQSKEFGAKCTFMASKCELTRFYDSEKHLPDSIDFEADGILHVIRIGSTLAGTAPKTITTVSETPAATTPAPSGTALPSSLTSTTTSTGPTAPASPAGSAGESVLERMRRKRQEELRK